MPGQELLEEIINIPSAQSQVDKLIGLLDQADSRIKATNQLVLSMGTGGTSSNITAQTQQMQQANTALVNMQRALEEQSRSVAQAQAMYTQSISQNIAQLNQLKGSMNSHKADLKENLALLKAGTINRQEYNRRINETTQKLSEYKIKVAELNGVINNQVKQNIAVTGSMDEMSQRLGLLRNSYRALSEEQRNSEGGKIMLADIQRLDTQVKTLDATIGNHQRNVGNYSSALTGYANILRGLRGPTKLLGEALGFSATAADQLRLVIENSLQGLAALSRGNEKAKAKAEEAAAATAAQAEAQAAAAATGEGEAVAMDGVAASTEAATAATTGFVSVLMSTGIGAIIVLIATAIGFLIEAIYSWVTAEKHLIESSKNLAEAEKAVFEARNKGIEDTRKYNDIRKRALEDELAGAEKSGQSQEKLFAIKKKIAQFDYDNATHLANQNLITNESLNATIQKYTEAKQSVDYYNREIARTDAIIKGNAGKSFFSRDSHLDVDDLKKKQEAAKAEMEALEADKNGQLQVLEDQANAKKVIDETLIEEAKKNADERRKIALEDVQLETDLTKAKNAKILADEKSTLGQRLDAIKSNQKAERDLLIAQRVNITSDPSISKGDKAEARKKYREENQKLAIETNTALAKVQDEYEKRDFAATQSTERSKLELAAYYDTQAIADKRKSYEQRLIAFEDYQKKQFALNELSRVAALKKEGLTDKEIEAINVEHQNKLLEIQEKAAMDRIKLALDEANAKFKGGNTSNEVGELEAEYNALQRVHDAYKNGTISLEKYNKQKEKVYETAALTTLKAEEQLLLQQKAAYMKLGEDTKDIDKAIAANRIKQQQIAFKSFDEAAKESRKKFLDLFMEIAGLASKAMSLISSAMEGKFTEQKNHVQEVEEQQQKTYEKEVDNISKSSLSEQDKANKLKILESQRQAQKEANAREQKKIDIEKAKFDKAAGMFNIVISTAEAVVKALPNIPLSIAVGALGAAELGIAAAAPLPKYAKGRTGGPAEWALTDEQGPELYLEPGGNMFLGNDKPTMRYLKSGTTIIPAHEVTDALSSRMVVNAGGGLQEGRSFDELKDIMLWSTNKLAEAYKSRKAPVVNINNSGSWGEYYLKNVKE